MFSEIRKTISGYVPKPVVGVGSLSFAANERLPTPTTGFGAAGHVPAGLARWTRFPETFATIIQYFLAVNRREDKLKKSKTVVSFLNC